MSMNWMCSDRYGLTCDCGYGTRGCGMRNANPYSAVNQLECLAAPHSVDFHRISHCTSKKHGCFQMHIHIYTAKRLKMAGKRHYWCRRCLYKDILGKLVHITNTCERCDHQFYASRMQNFSVKQIRCTQFCQPLSVLHLIVQNLANFA